MDSMEILESTERIVIEPLRAIRAHETDALKGRCEGVLVSSPKQDLIRVKIGEGVMELQDLSLDQVYRLFFYVNTDVYEADGRIRERYRSERGAVCEFYMDTALMQHQNHKQL